MSKPRILFMASLLGSLLISIPASAQSLPAPAEFYFDEDRGLSLIHI